MKQEQIERLKKIDRFGRPTVADIRAAVETLERWKPIVDAAIVWKENHSHGRDICDEGVSVPREDDEQRLYELVERLLAAEAAKNES